MDSSITIGGRKVGPNEPAYIIAEVGSNHDGKLERAMEHIAAAKAAGADAVKFQSFTAEGLFNPKRPAEGEDINDFSTWESHPAYELIDYLTLPAEWHADLKSYADSIGIEFISAPFDSGRADLLNSIGVAAFKIASGDITHEPLIRQVAAFGKPVIISSGASTLGEVERAIEIMRGEGNTQVAVLHCVSLYPPGFDEANLRVLKTLQDAFAIPVGYSDHTPGHTIPLGAVTLGASIIEKHITLDKSLPGPDHPYALEPGEFVSMCREVRNLEVALGSGIKGPSEHEKCERTGARRSIYAATSIKAGEVLTKDMLKAVRHGYGVEPAKLPCMVGLKAGRDIEANELVRWKDIIG